jgi:hypothetical protein
MAGITPIPLHTFYGLDIGRRQDPAALVILDRQHTPTGQRDPVTYQFNFELNLVVRHAETFPLGLPYLELVRRIRSLIKPGQTLVVDASGVGDPIVELLRLGRHSPQGDGGAIQIYPIVITGGRTPTDSIQGGQNVPRKNLITNLRILWEKQVIKIPQSMYGKERLLDQLVHLEDHPTQKEDDLAIALSLAAWKASQGHHSLLSRTPNQCIPLLP